MAVPAVAVLLLTGCNGSRALELLRGTPPRIVSVERDGPFLIRHLEEGEGATLERHLAVFVDDKEVQPPYDGVWQYQASFATCERAPAGGSPALICAYADYKGRTQVQLLRAAHPEPKDLDADDPADAVARGRWMPNGGFVLASRPPRS